MGNRNTLKYNINFDLSTLWACKLTTDDRDILAKSVHEIIYLSDKIKDEFFQVVIKR